ncbi:MAG: DUF1194 domain-containing protein [Phycisphaeraceae bacterium]|nr:DUF1194 domain-containing protein [Phycisphaeraceae bacterium]
MTVEANYGGGLEKLAAFYEENPDKWRHDIDLNGDGINEAICTNTFWADKPA